MTKAHSLGPFKLVQSAIQCSFKARRISKQLLQFRRVRDISATRFQVPPIYSIRLDQCLFFRVPAQPLYFIFQFN